MPKANTTWFTSYYLHYKEKSEIIEFAHNLFFFRPSLKLLSLCDVLSDCIIKVIAAYHLHYKDKLISNPTQSFICAANSFYFLYNLENLSTISLLACNGAYIAEPGLVTKKRKLSKTSLYFFSHPFQAPFFLSLMLFKYITMFK